MTTIQKTWADLLGKNFCGCSVLSLGYKAAIVRHDASKGWERVLWSFDSVEDAQAAFAQWKKECRE